MKSLKVLAIIAILCLNANLARANTLIDRMVKPFVGLGTASGIVIKSYRAENKNWTIVLTGWHVIDGLPDKKKIPGDFMEYNEQGKIVKRTKFVGSLAKGDKTYDYAFIIFNTDRLWETAKVNYKKKLSLFDKIFVVGRPNGEKLWVTEGIISSLDPPADMKDKGYFGHEGKIHFGNSGGPIYDEDGILIGLALRVARQTIQTQFGPAYSTLNHISYGLGLKQIYNLLSENERSLYF